MSVTTGIETGVAERKTSPLLELEDLKINFYSARGVVAAVRGVSLDVDSGSTLGLVGESGSGKSVTAMSILGLVPSPGRLDGGSIRWRGEDVTQEKKRAALRGKKVTVVFQDPMTSLNPLVPVGRQITEVLKKHKGMHKEEAKDRAIELLDLVGIPSPAQRISQLPFELSGGMRQRVMIAIALAPDPELLIADEPTTALDVTIQAQILELIAELQRSLGIAMILITHDLGVVAGVCDQVAVMYAGKVVERGPALDVFEDPKHPYTAGLLASTPRLDQPTDRMIPIGGAPPDLSQELAACPFAPRCSHRLEKCTTEVPVMAEYGPQREAACWNAL